MKKFLLILLTSFLSISLSAQEVSGSPKSSMSVAKIRGTEQPVFGTLALGTAFPTGLESDSLLYNVVGAINYNFTQNVSGKIFGDIAMGAARDSARFMNFGTGLDYYFMNTRIGRATPYFTGDAGLGLTRTTRRDTANALALGAGLGLRLASENINWDINLHFTSLTSQNEGSTPSVLGLRGGVNF